MSDMTFNAQPVPRHVAVTMSRDCTFDLIVTLRAAVRDLEGLPESIQQAILPALEASYDGDLPGGISDPLEAV